MSTGDSNQAVPEPEARPLRLVFDRGTVIVEVPTAGDDPGLPGVKFDPRTKAFRAEAIWYRTLVEQIRSRKIAYTDDARAYNPTPWKIQVDKKAFPHQT